MARERHFQTYLDSLLSVKTFSTLDVKIKNKEVIEAIQNLKNNKACGLDGIKNEMLKNSQTHILPCIVKLFNHILSSGSYPSNWKTGYIKPLYKGDDPNLPSNYRGITVMPCLAKLFNSILKTIFHVLFRLKIKINHINILILVQKTKFHMRVYKLMTF